MDKDLHRIRFMVADTGIGISEVDVANIFSEYGQATNETSHHYGGTGLGLTISKKLVHLMKGDLQVTSQLQKGSEFYFTISVPAEDENATEKPKIVSFTDLSPFEGKRILVAEDNFVNSLLIKNT